jgi:hypothetical protein
LRFLATGFVVDDRLHVVTNPSRGGKSSKPKILEMRQQGIEPN